MTPSTLTDDDDDDDDDDDELNDMKAKICKSGAQRRRKMIKWTQKLYFSSGSDDTGSELRTAP
jgi:hypothetical protein